MNDTPVELVNVETPPQSKKPRMVSADIIRIAACFSVLSIHFLLNSDFYKEDITGTNMIIMLTMRMLFSVCVPLFIILTGYLMINKPLSTKHYAKGMKVVWIYLLASLACIIYKVYIKEWGTFEDSLKDILKYTAAPYGWYIEMYFGLYLMIPFLNILYNHLPSKGWKIALIVTFFALNSLPKIVNGYNFTEPGWWSNPSLSTEYQRIIPQWWLGTYPITYYFIGAYLREYGLNLNKILHRVLIVVTLAASTLYLYWRSDGSTFAWGWWSDWEFPLTLILTTLVFELLAKKNFNKLPRIVTKIIGYVSGVCLSIYLVSYIFDTEFYAILKQRIPTIPDRLWSYFIIVPIIFLCSFALSTVLDLIYRLFYFIYTKIKRHMQGLIEAKRESQDEIEYEEDESAAADVNESEPTPEAEGTVTEPAEAINMTDNTPEEDRSV